MVREKELTRARDALSVERRRRSMVEIDKEYELEGPHGRGCLLDLFEGRRSTTTSTSPSTNPSHHSSNNYRTKEEWARTDFPMGRRRSAPRISWGAVSCSWMRSGIVLSVRTHMGHSGGQGAASDGQPPLSRCGTHSRNSRQTPLFDVVDEPRLRHTGDIPTVNRLNVA
ncbi:DUF899 domain-containing protein [Nonomuraea turkmeniaca]|uniref:DUF899 domain-containing protein n=1 Tax=Nonomuraea turkmeniaca TaxID=103838 RepID=A0A5S4FNY5_9ACTN|nr:DUF899 domain-containing protein [Nonomuraea turkmeniaca]